RRSFRYGRVRRSHELGVTAHAGLIVWRCTPCPAWILHGLPSYGVDHPPQGIGVLLPAYLLLQHRTPTEHGVLQAPGDQRGKRRALLVRYAMRIALLKPRLLLE